jgi:asparagine synthase (glutamine-hydrolysing)
MCGILGQANWTKQLPAVGDLSRATNLLHHRGPDGGACWHEAGIFLGHRRLSIIDLACGQQPMATRNYRYVIIFNGEIYNYPELQQELRQAGAVFQTASDTEVILEGYGRWGIGVLERLQGMFAFGLWDRVERSLLLARDRFGEKSLLYSDTPGTVTFASEVAPLAALGVAGRDIDSDGLGGYLCLNYVPGDATLLRDVRRVPPASWRKYSATGAVSTGRYWSARVAHPQPSRSDEETLDALQERLDAAARLALRSDVPIGLFLSGGVDSSLVARSAANLGKLDAAYCVDFSAEGFSEWPRAAAVATRIGVPLERVSLDVNILDEFLDVVRHLDDPLADSSAMAVWAVSRSAGAKLKVVLSGDGGDELFGGYLTYAASRWHRRLRPWLPRAAWQSLASLSTHLPVNTHVKVGADYKLQRFLRAMPFDTAHAHFTWNGTWLPADAAALCRDTACRRAASDALHALRTAHALAACPSTHDLQIADVEEYLPNDILCKVDRATMAHGLESRAPLLNQHVAELALALPDHLRTDKRGGTKIALRRLCARHFGHAHAFAPKQGFSIPVHTWLRDERRALVTHLLARDRVDATGVLDPDAVARVVDAHMTGRRALGWELWGLMVLVAWYEQRVASPPRFDHLPELPVVSLPAVTQPTHVH